MYDAAEEMYSLVNARCVRHSSSFFFDKYKSTVKLAHIERDDEIVKYQGAEIALICFDELTHFTQRQFDYLLSRNRSKCGVKPYMRCTCNPKPDSWVREFIDWYIKDDGYPNEDRCGVIRYFVHRANEYHWFNSIKEAKEAYPKGKVRSFTFISSNIHDNKILLRDNPDYLAILDNLPTVEREQLYLGNWNKSQAGTGFFEISNFKIVDFIPYLRYTVRAWDFAFTKVSVDSPDPDYTVGIKVGLSKENVFYVIDLIRFREAPGIVERNFVNISSQDGYETLIRIPIDAGGMAKGYIYNLENKLKEDNLRYNFESKRVSKSKETRAAQSSVQCKNNNIKLLRAKWNKAFLNELNGFPKGSHDDQVDALSDAIEQLLDIKKPVSVIRKPWER